MVDKTLMPKDSRNNHIPVLGIKAGGSQTVTSNSGGTARNTTPLSAMVVTITTRVDVRIRLGTDNTVVATDSDFPILASMGPQDISINNREDTQITHIAVKTFSGGVDGEVYISERI